MTEEELIKNFKYNGFNIDDYQNKIKVIPADCSGMIDKSGQSIATTNTFSCTNILVFNNDFAYLVHMLPSETVGMNNNFQARINELKEIIINKNITSLNILISFGESTAKDPNKDFHNLDYIKKHMKDFINYCNQYDIELWEYQTIKSKFLLYDLSNQTLIVNNKDKATINIKKLDKFKTNLTIKNNVKTR